MYTAKRSGTGSLWQLFSNYLSNRKQCVVIDGHHSDWLPVHSGVLLGPLLFAVYINDLPTFVSSSSTFLFADDTKISKFTPTLADTALLQADLNSLFQWSFTSLLCFNANKSLHMHFHSKASDPVSYHLGDSTIKTVSTWRDLGVVYSEDLSWSEHYKYITKKAYSKLNFLRSSKDGRSQ